MSATPAGIDVSFLGRLARALVESLDSRETLQRMADLSVPGLADWCAIDRPREGGGYERMAVAHSDPAKVQIAHDLWKLYPPSPDDPQGLAQVIRTGQPELYPDITDEMVAQGARDARQLAMLRQLGLKSFVLVPLVARRRVLGALTLVHAESARRFTAEQIPLLGEFAQLAALALDNALLFEQTHRSLEGEREARQRLEATEQQLRTFIDHLPALAWTAGADGRVDYYNQRWYQYTGLTPEQMNGDILTRLHDTSFQGPVRERWRHSLQTGEPFEMEFPLRGADGVQRWFLTRVAPVRDGNGNIVRWFGTNTEIDAIRQALALSEAMRQQSEETAAALLALREEKARAEQRVAELERLLASREGR